MFCLPRWLVAVSALVAAGCSPTFALAKEMKLADVIKLADHIQLEALLGTPVVMAGERTKAFLKVGLTGMTPPDGVARTPVNIAILLDKSSSMSGQKMSEARRAAKLAVNRLGPDDIVSIVTYDSVVRVVVPATKVTDKDAINGAIDEVFPSGSTALFGGVSKAAAELRKFFDHNRVNRIILLSDGMANIGPSSPGELAELGTSLAAEGITVTTIGLGLGYNEDLMMQLARASEGNHAFVENAVDLVRIFEYELGDVLSVVAQDVDVKIALAEGVRLLRVLGRDALIDGQVVSASLNQLYADQEKYILLEVEISPMLAGKSRNLAEVSVDYANSLTRKRDKIDQIVRLEATRSAKLIATRTNAAVMIAATELMASEQNRLAIALRDQGKIEEARKVLRKSTELLGKKSKQYRSKKLKELEKKNIDFSDNLLEGDWAGTRKQMRKMENDIVQQQTW